MITGNPFPSLHTKRLLLRQANQADALALWEIRSNEMVNRFIDRPSDIVLEDVRSFIEKINNAIAENKTLYWMITMENKLAGTVCFWNIPPSQQEAELGYELHPDFQGIGIMQEALEAVTSYGFNTAGFNKIYALPKEENERSVRLLEKLHFEIDTEPSPHFNPGSESGYIIYSLAVTN